MKIYTRRGDRGETDLFGGARVAKDHLRVTAYGEVDELNAFVGVGAAASTHADVGELCRRVQSSLFDLGSYLATPDADRREKGGIPMVDAAEVTWLEERMDAFEAELAPLKSFILPGGTPAAAAFHVAHTVCRRAERAAVALDREESLSELALRYLNRLSDLLFVLARVENRRADVADVEWVGRER
ncbi:MAG: cob(I)yrinic acid a,c-diamide adenosyltransferase [Proteobacteria bacterium]|nr:cob(I)yrinic acid a,c-diamide adenosyltransferase [Pseudomonadota bacterium]